MTADPQDDLSPRAETKPERPPLGANGRPWVGSLLSLVLPGLGLARAGRVGQGLMWFVGLEVGTVIVAMAFAFEWVPFWLASSLCFLDLAAALYLLYLSYWGSVPRRNVYGKVTGICHPFSRVGRLR